MMPHEASPSNVPPKRSLPEDIPLPALKRSKSAMTSITIADDDENTAVRYATPVPPWPPRGKPCIQGGQENARGETEEHRPKKAVPSLPMFSILNGREEKAYIAELEQKVQDLKSQVSDLTRDVCEREVLYKEACQQQGQLKEDNHADLKIRLKGMRKEKKELKENADKEKRSLTAERDVLQEQLEGANKVILKDQAQLDASQERYNKLLAQNQKLAKDFRKRGEEIVKMTRNLHDGRPKSNTAPAAATSRTPAASPTQTSTFPFRKMKTETRERHDDSKRTLLTRLGGMFAHYRTLYEKNETLVEKLMNMAKAGGFGHHSSLYRKEVENLRGKELEDLAEYKRHV